MAIFWSFWIPLNFMFWWFVAARVDGTSWMHFMVGSFFAVVTGVVPFLLYQCFKYRCDDGSYDFWSYRYGVLCCLYPDKKSTCLYRPREIYRLLLYRRP